MINSDRIVPVMRTDLLSLYDTVLNLIGTSHEVLESPDVDGNFVVEATGDAGNVLCNQPAKTIDFAAGTTAGVVYFIPAFDFAGFSLAGVAEIPEGEVIADGATLYKATLSSGDITVTAL